MALSKTKQTNSKTKISNCKHGLTKTSPMRLKIVRSREASPTILSSSSQTKIMGNVNIKKIRLINAKSRCLGTGFKPVTTQISLYDNKPSDRKRTQILNAKHVKEPIKKNGYIKGAKLVELSFEEEIDVDNIYKENTILDDHLFQQFKRPKIMHKRQISEFEEDGLENLSSEGNEYDTLNQPKIQQDKFNNLNKKYSRNADINNNISGSQLVGFKTDKPNERGNLYKSNLLVNKLTSTHQKHENPKDSHNIRRSMHKGSKAHNLNRSRNKGRNDSRDESYCELASSSILKESLSTLTSKEVSKRLSKNYQHIEKEVDQKKLKQKSEIKEKIFSEMHYQADHQSALDKRKINNQVLGNIIKNNINELASKNIAKLANKESLKDDKKPSSSK